MHDGASYRSALGQLEDRLALLEDPITLLKGLFLFAPTPIAVYRANGQILFCNQAVEELFGSRPPAGYNVLRDEVLEEQGLLPLLQRAFLGETVRLPTHWYDARGLRHVHVERGQRVGVDVTIFPLQSRDGVVRHVAFCFRDMTATMELESARDQLRSKEAHLKASQRIAQLGSWELDLDNLANVDDNPLRWSDELFRLFGYEPGEIEVTNENFFLAVHPDDREKIQKAVRRALSGGPDYVIEHRIRRADGVERLVREQSEIQRDPRSGRPTKMIGTTQDISDRAPAAPVPPAALQDALDALDIVAFEIDEDAETFVFAGSVESVLGFANATSPVPFAALRACVHADDHDALKRCLHVRSLPAGREPVVLRVLHPVHGEILTRGFVQRSREQSKATGALQREALARGSGLRAS